MAASTQVHELVFERSMHSADAIQRAIYVLSDRLSADLVTEAELYRCTVHLPADADDVESTLADFRNEVLDQTLRERVRGETAEARNLILALAFSNTGLVERGD